VTGSTDPAVPGPPAPESASGSSATPAPPTTWSRVKAWTHRHQKAILIVGSLVTAGIILALLWGRRDEFGTALTEVSLHVLVITCLLQALGRGARSESWHQAVRAAGATVSRRVLFRASAMQVLGSIINGQLGVAMRIAALRRSSPEVTPKIPTLIAAEFPIVAVELMFAAVASFTLVGPLGLPWWTPLAAFALAFAIGWGMRRLSHRPGRELWAGLTVLRHPRGAALLSGALLVAILCQVVRNWMLLRAVGVDASFWDGVAVLIAVATLAQLPTGPAAGAAAAVLILGSEGVAAAAPAGVQMTVTGTIGGLLFAAWSGGDRLWAFRQDLRRAAAEPPGPPGPPAMPPGL
jgi:uncharacterized membrane protein YbhN (UPF0104 family)